MMCWQRALREADGAALGAGEGSIVRRRVSVPETCGVGGTVGTRREAAGALAPSVLLAAGTIVAASGLDEVPSVEGGAGAGAESASWVGAGGTSGAGAVAGAGAAAVDNGAVGTGLLDIGAGASLAVGRAVDATGSSVRTPM
jgi:hypothetical protein